MSGRPKVSDDEFIAAWRKCGGSPRAVAQALELDERGIYSRRQRLAKRGVILETSPGDGRMSRERIWTRPSPVRRGRFDIDVPEGVVIVFSDAHYWPGHISVGHRALLQAIRDLRPCAIIANGDVLDGATISRHERNGWGEQRPLFARELAEAKDRLGEIEEAGGVDCCYVWNLGNHDTRFERFLATNAPEMEGVPGTSLPEHFPRWEFGVSTQINPQAHLPVIVKHRQANGLHAGYNNTLRGGVHTVTGHVHRLLITPWGDYRGRRYGIDTGCLADPFGPQFDYMEDAPVQGASGFAVLTFHGGELAPPELVEVRGDQAFFRGRPLEFAT